MQLLFSIATESACMKCIQTEENQVYHLFQFFSCLSLESCQYCVGQNVNPGEDLSD